MNSVTALYISNRIDRKQEFRRTDFGSRLLAVEGEGVSEVKQYPSGSG